MIDNPNKIAGTTENIDNSYGGKDINMAEGQSKGPDGKEVQNDPKKGKASLMNTISVLHYQAPGMESVSSYFTKDSRYFKEGLATNYKNPTGSRILEAFAETNRVEGDKTNDHNFRYAAGDFLFLDDYGKVPNNHLLTLRRFPAPCGDDIKVALNAPLPDVSRMLTYMDGEDNKMESILSFSPGFKWKQFKSDIQTQDKSKFGWGKLDALGPILDPDRYAKEKLQGQGRTDFDPYESHKDNYTWGPIDVIDELTVRDQGLTFKQDIKLKFKYAVRSYNGISTKASFLDILGNVLMMTSNKAPFWGGAVRFKGGGGYSGPMGDQAALAKGDISGFITSFASDMKKKVAGVFSGGIKEGIKKVLGAVAAKIIGGEIDKLGRPEQYGLHSLLTGNPTGEWHLTVGNPFNPVMMIGNLVLESSDISFEGPFTIDDVPSYVVVELTVKPGMPRDKYAIQSMFNQGKGRYYASDIDFKERSYYRNKALTGSGSGATKSATGTSNNIINRAKDAGDYVATKASSGIKYAKSAYKSV